MSANIPATETGQDPQQEAPKKQKKKIERHTLKPDHLMSNKGIKGLYEKTQKLDLSSHDEYKNLTEVTNALRTWHYQLMPKYSLNLFLDRCISFGNNKTIQYFMNKARRVHKGEDTWFNENENEGQNNREKGNQENQENPGEEEQKGEDLESKTPQPNGELVRVMKKMTVSKQDDSESDDDELAELIKRTNLLKPEKKVKVEDQEFQNESIGDYMPPDFDDDFE